MMLCRAVLVASLLVALGCQKSDSASSNSGDSTWIDAPADVAAVPATASKTPSGLAYRVIKPGTGTKHPVAANQVTVDYSGWTLDGKQFDSSVKRGSRATFGLTQVIKGWTEGVPLMVVGERTRFWIPANLAYGDNPGSGRPAGMLVFDIELFAID